MSLAVALTSVRPGDTIQLRSGDYAGTYALRIPGVTLEPYPGESPRFTGPAKLTTSKVAWLHIYSAAAGATVRNLNFTREGDSAALWRVGWNDYGIVVEGPEVTVTGCGLAGMAKGIHVKGSQSTGGTITYNAIGPTIDSNIAIGSSYGVVRGLLVAWNDLGGSYREDGIQFMPNFDAADPAADISNLGAIIYSNYIHDCNENAIDLKGAGQVIIDGNKFRRVAGSSNGAPDWNHRSNGVIIRGARTSTGRIIGRNNDCQECCSGFWMFPGWKFYNNLLQDDNWSPWDVHQGVGISQREGVKDAALKNNLVRRHLAGDLQLLANATNIECNPTAPGPGVALTLTRGAGSGRIVAVEDASYFTDWFGRKELPADVIWLGGQRFEVRLVHHDGNAIALDRNAKWGDGDPVFWRSPQPIVGIQPEYTQPVVVEPPNPTQPNPTTPTEPTEPPTEPPAPPAPEPVEGEMVQITISVNLAPYLADAFRAALESLIVSVQEIDAPLPTLALDTDNDLPPGWRVNA
jgi:hypothetical protein